MKVTFIMPCVGKKPGVPYVKTWQMEPLVIATLSFLTPPGIEKKFYDDRLEEIPYDEPTDLVAITVETYTARRAYQISAEFRKRGVPVVMGGFHPSLMPEEAGEQSDAVVIGEAEQSWPALLKDFIKGGMKKVYQAEGRPDLGGIKPDRSIYAGKKYSKITLMEVGRGCRFSCEFCSITSFFKKSYRNRPVEDVVEELKTLDKSKIVFFVDDNIAADMANASRLFSAMKGLGIKWISQISINAAGDEMFVKRMKDSGCLGVLIGFESIHPESLKAMGKGINNSAKDYDEAMALFRRHGLVVYATFVFGYDQDGPGTFEKTYEFAQRHKFFFTAFNHLVPFPGTPLYEKLETDERLLYENWWLQEDYRFGKLAFQPKNLSPEDISEGCLKFRKKMYSLPSIIRRGLDFKCNSRNFFMAFTFFLLNFLSGKDVELRQGLPLGKVET